MSAHTFGAEVALTWGGGGVKKRACTYFGGRGGFSPRVSLLAFTMSWDTRVIDCLFSSRAR